MTAVLDEFFHKRLLDDKVHVCQMAGLQPRFLSESMTEYCGPKEVEWVVRFHTLRAEGVPGLAVIGLPKPDTRCQAICAALVRNYINARVLPLNTILGMSADEAVEPTVALIPNLFMATNGKAMPAFKIQNLYDLLLARSVHSKPTVVCVESKSSLVTSYGQPFAHFLDGFSTVTAL